MPEVLDDLFQKPFETWRTTDDRIEVSKNKKRRKKLKVVSQFCTVYSQTASALRNRIRVILKTHRDPSFMIKVWGHVHQFSCIRSTSIQRWRIAGVSLESSCNTCTKCHRVWLGLQRCCRGAAGDSSQWGCCCCFKGCGRQRVQGTECGHSSDLTAIPEISSSPACSSLWPMPFLPFSFPCSPYRQELICTMCSLMEKETGSVWTRYHCKSPLPPVLLSPLLFSLIRILLACHTLDMLEITPSWEPAVNLLHPRGGGGRKRCRRRSKRRREKKKKGGERTEEKWQCGRGLGGGLKLAAHFQRRGQSN